MSVLGKVVHINLAAALLNCILNSLKYACRLPVSVCSFLLTAASMSQHQLNVLTHHGMVFYLYHKKSNRIHSQFLTLCPYHVRGVTESDNVYLCWPVLFHSNYRHYIRYMLMIQTWAK